MNTAIAAQAGISGSTKIGKNVMIADKRALLAILALPMVLKLPGRVVNQINQRP